MTTRFKLMPRWSKRRRCIAVVVGLGALALAAWFLLWPVAGIEPPLTPDQFAALMGCRFDPAVAEPMRTPIITAIELPKSALDAAVRGATGRDARGHIWLAVSEHSWDRTPLSAHIHELLPELDETQDHGDALGQLRRLGMARPDESQAEIRTRPIQASDGKIYFATQDRRGALFNGRKLSSWGSHLWRIDPEHPGDWEHIAAVPEGLIALGGAGRHIVALGWFGHVVYHYDIETKRLERARAGSIGGHTSSNLLCDHRGHAYVPRVEYTTDSPSRLVVTLIEFDADLREIGGSPIATDVYAPTDLQESHGITAVQYLRDRSMVFITQNGFVHRVTPRDGAPATLDAIGPLMTDSKRSVTSLLTLDGSRYIAAVANPTPGTGEPPEWLVFDLESRKVAYRVSLDSIRSRNGTVVPPGALEFFGSITRDDAGRFYLGGRAGDLPMLFQLDLGERSSGTDTPRLARAESPRLDSGTPTERVEPNPRPAEVPPPRPADEPEPAPPPVAAPFDPPASLAGPKADDPILQRFAFRRELRNLMARLGPEAGPAILVLCKREGQAVTPATRAALEEAAARLDRVGRVKLSRTRGLSEAVILQDLLAEEGRRIGSRNGPRNQNDAILNAAKFLLSVPP